MALLVYNTLSRKKEEFLPLEQGKVRMYVCGLTVQERPHIGHMRAAIVADLIQRWLEYKRFEVTQIQNITDVDDKVIEKAKKENRDYRQIAEETLADARDFVSTIEAHLRSAGYLAAV